jgi:hypothetical protein
VTYCSPANGITYLRIQYFVDPNFSGYGQLALSISASKNQKKAIIFTPKRNKLGLSSISQRVIEG